MGIKTVLVPTAYTGGALDFEVQIEGFQKDPTTATVTLDYGAGKAVQSVRSPGPPAR